MKNSTKYQDSGKLDGSVNQTTSSISSEELVKYVEIEDTPFMAVKNNDAWILTTGRYKVAGPFKSEEETREATKDVSWNTLCTVILSMIENAEIIKNNK